MLNFFSVVLNDVYKQCAALLCSCFLFCSSLRVMKMFRSSIEYSLRNSTFNSFTVVPMEVSYKRSAALVFAGFLYRSSLNIESFREFWKTTLANLMLNFSLLLSLMSINNVLLCCSRASFSVSSRNHEVVQIFYTICSAKLSFKSFTIVLMQVSYQPSAVSFFACFLYCSSLNIETPRVSQDHTCKCDAEFFLSGSQWCLL